MKKLMTILVVFALCGAVMAQNAQTVDPEKPIDLTKYNTVGGREISKQQYNNLSYREQQWVTVTGYGNNATYYYNEHQVVDPNVKSKTHNYLNLKDDGTLGDSGLTYTITNSKDASIIDGYTRQSAQGYFTTATSGPEGKVLAVQFLGAEREIKDRNGNVYPNYHVTDYGIYLYDPATGEVGEYLKASEHKNYFSVEEGLTPGKSFGVFFIDGDGNIIASTGDGMKQKATGEKEWYRDRWGNWRQRDVMELVKAENGILGNYDDDPHELKIYTEPGATEPDKVNTDKHFLCLSEGKFGDSVQITHFEFMLQTTWDDPYYPVNPGDFFDDGNQVNVDDPVVNGDMSGQPLPGTLATLLIGSLCASTLRKKNKKH